MAMIRLNRLITVGKGSPYTWFDLWDRKPLINYSTSQSFQGMPAPITVDLIPLRQPADQDFAGLRQWADSYPFKNSNNNSKSILWGDTPYYAAGAGISIADSLANRGASNAVGNTFNTLGDVGMMLPGPYKAIGLGLKGLGFIANGFTNSVNKDYQRAKNNQIADYATTSSNASDYAGLLMDMDDALTNTVDLGKIGDWGSKGFLSSGSKRRNAFNTAKNALATATDARIADINQRGLEINRRNTFGQLGNLTAFGGYIGGALDIMQDDKHIDAINNRSIALAKQPNRFPGGGGMEGFLNMFKQDPIKGAVDYINTRRHMSNIFEEAQEANAREKAFQDMQRRVAAAETQNQGLQSLLNSQGLTIQNLMNQQLQNNYADNWEQRMNPSVAPNDTAVMARMRKSLIDRGVDNRAHQDAIIANMMVESSGNPNAKNPKSSARGLMQWLTGRQPKAWDWDSQVDHIVNTYNKFGGDNWLDKEAYNKFMNTTDSTEAARLFRRYWERPEEHTYNFTDKYINQMYSKKAFGGEIEKPKYKPGYGGGSFRGSGAGGSWEKETKDTYNVTNFNEAFDAAVNEGLKEFIFQGRRYNTQKENNPVREYNNRWVGQGRKADVKNPSKAYDHEAGPLGGPLAAIPMVTDTYIGSPERPPQLDYNPFAMERGTMLPYSWSRTVDRPKTVRAFGGELGTNGTDFTNGIIEINTGDTHENNPMQGVPMGIDENGVPNLVEEGETVFNDYVFSNRLTVPYFMKNELGLGGIIKNDITFADASKKIAEESTERPNDPISIDGLKAGLSKLAQVQEAERMRIQAEEDNAQMEMMNQLPLGTYAHGGGIHIDPSKKGTFKAQASKMGMGVQKAASHILANKENYSPAMVKKANFAKNFAHAYGGELGNIFEGKGNKPNNIRRRGISGEYLGNWDDMPVFHTPGLLEAAQMAEEQYHIDTRAKALMKKGKSREAAYKQATEERANLSTGIAPTAGRGRMTYKHSTPRGIYARNKAAYTQARLVAKPKQSAGPNMKEQINYRGIRPTRGKGESYNPYAGAVESTGTAPNGVKYTIDNRGNVNVLDPYTGNLSFPDPTRVDRLKTVLGASALGASVIGTGIAAYNYLQNPGGVAPVNNLAASVGIGNIPYSTLSDPLPQNTPEVVNATPENPKKGGTGGGNTPKGNKGRKVPVTVDNSIPVTPAAATPETTLTPLQQRALGINTDFARIDSGLQGAVERDINREVAEQMPRVAEQVQNDLMAQYAQDNFDAYPTWMRYAPAVGAGIMSLTDALGLTNKSDYTYANKIEAAANRLGYAPNIGYNPVDGYVAYNPFDRNYVANRMLDNSAGLRRSILNSNASNGARNQMMLAQNALDQQGLGQMYRQADESNINQRLQTGDFNRRTKIVNSQLGLEAAMANARFRQQAQNSRLSGLAQAAAMRDAIDQRVGASRSANLTNFLTSLGNIGRENMAFNMINSDRAWDYGIRRNGVTGFKNRRRG